MTELELKQAEYIKYLEKAIESESIIRDITLGVRNKFKSELSVLSSEPRELFEKVYIRSEADLPDNNGKSYISMSHSGNIGHRRCVPNTKYKTQTFENISSEWWLGNIVWYLQPLAGEGKEGNK